jgi:ABC-2 type transport system ATP-binding protein
VTASTQGVADRPDIDSGGAPAIVVDGLVKRYGDRAVVDDVSFSIEPGEVVALLGPNGAGKTTTIEIIEGFRRADGGTARVLGADPDRAGRDLRARLGIMLQAGGFDMRARPTETIHQYGRFHADPLDTTALLARVGLERVARTPYRRLSGGERQRLAFAVAIVGRPDVVILDEPTAGMDPEARAMVREQIGELREAGLAILLSSHDLSDVERLADRIVIMSAGRVVASGTPAELAAGVHPRLRFRLDRAIDADELGELARVVGAVIEEIEPGWYEVRDAHPTPALVAAVARACAGSDRLIIASRATGGTLEEAYLDLLGPGVSVRVDEHVTSSDARDVVG